MDSLYLIQSIIIGLSIAAPIGPISLICIRSALSGGIRSGIVSGLGVAFADTFYASIAAAGLSSLSTLLMQYENHLRILGGLFIAYLGLSALSKTLQSNKANEGIKIKHRYSDEPEQRCWRTFFSTCLLTLTNPMTILSFAALLGGSGVVTNQLHVQKACPFIAGIFIGSALWWIFLSIGVAYFRKYLLSPRTFRVVNLSSSVLLIVIGACYLVSAFLK
ncbi:Leucine efflux protein [compost metagenome]